MDVCTVSMDKIRAKQVLVSVRNAQSWIEDLEDADEKKEAIRCLENAEDELHNSIREMSKVNDKEREG